MESHLDCGLSYFYNIKKSSSIAELAFAKFDKCNTTKSDTELLLNARESLRVVDSFFQNSISIKHFSNKAIIENCIFISNKIDILTAKSINNSYFIDTIIKSFQIQTIYTNYANKNMSNDFILIESMPDYEKTIEKCPVYNQSSVLYEKLSEPFTIYFPPSEIMVKDCTFKKIQISNELSAPIRISAESKSYDKKNTLITITNCNFFEINTYKGASSIYIDHDLSTVLVHKICVYSCTGGISSCFEIDCENLKFGTSTLYKSPNKPILDNHYIFTINAQRGHSKSINVSQAYAAKSVVFSLNSNFTFCCFDNINVYATVFVLLESNVNQTVFNSISLLEASIPKKTCSLSEFDLTTQAKFYNCYFFNSTLPNVATNFIDSVFVDEYYRTHMPGYDAAQQCYEATSITKKWPIVLIAIISAIVFIAFGFFVVMYMCHVRKHQRNIEGRLAMERSILTDFG